MRYRTTAKQIHFAEITPQRVGSENIDEKLRDIIHIYIYLFECWSQYTELLNCLLLVYRPPDSAGSVGSVTVVVEETVVEETVEPPVAVAETVDPVEPVPVDPVEPVPVDPVDPVPVDPVEPVPVDPVEPVPVDPVDPVDPVPVDPVEPVPVDP